MLIDAISPITGRNLINGSLGLIIFLMWFVVIIKDKQLFTKMGNIGKLMLGYFLLNVLFLFVLTKELDAGRKAIQSEQLLLSFYFLGLVYFTSEKRVVTFFKIVLIFYIFNILFALYQQIIGLPEFHKEYLYKTAGTIAFYDELDYWTGQIYYKVSGFSSCNYDLFYILTMLSIIILSGWHYFKEKLGKAIIVIFMVSYALLLFLTLERGPIMMFAALPLAFINRKRKLALYLFLLIFFVLFISYLEPILTSYGSMRLTRLAEITHPLEDTTMNYRMENRYAFSIPLIFKSPFGVGLDHELALTAHNSYIKVFLQLGWLGGILFLYIIYSSLRLCFKNAKLVDSLEHKNLIYGIAAALVSMLLIGIPNIPFSNDSGIFYWLFLAMVVKMPVITRDKPYLDRVMQ
ncbi:MAG TPA: hypothetical protein PLP19_01450 [bacterium]|nr:hypothetical protein [bacterium]HPN42130.1 hypothetical protein [bacterium]